MKNAIWMIVDLEDKELPLYVAMTVQEIADWAGTTKDSVLSSITHAKEKGHRCRFVRIYLDDNDEILQEERASKLFGYAAIAKYIDVSAKTVRRHAGEMPIKSIGCRFYAEKEDIDQWMQAPPEWLIACRENNARS